MEIRLFGPDDWSLVLDWWKASGEVPPELSYYPRESSFVVCDGGRPILAVAIYMTNCVEMALAENFISDPTVDRVRRRFASEALADYVADWCRKCGYRRLVALTEKEKLMSRWCELGFVKTLSGLSGFVRVL